VYEYVLQIDYDQYFESMAGARRDGKAQQQYYDFSLKSARAAQVGRQAGRQQGVGAWIVLGRGSTASCWQAGGVAHCSVVENACSPASPTACRTFIFHC